MYPGESDELCGKPGQVRNEAAVVAYESGRFTHCFLSLAMSVYLPLARRYRPKKFSDVIGQDIVVKILSQAIKRGRLGSAVLLNGTRGIGKTTIARILAKVVRCESGAPDACGKCPACLSFETNNIDIVELDAASHTGVDDIREIIDSCKYLPSVGKFKVFIIDEVHMLSKSAFNALLKTLEEPPEHIKFIFATTELYKIPETVLSRCLRFDLKRIDTNLLTQFLSSVCAKESVNFEEGAIRLIAQSANGSVRDALSILEQAINISDEGLSEVQIREMLCGISYTEAFSLLKRVLDADAKYVISALRNSFANGTSATQIINSMMSLVHKMTCLHIGASYSGDCTLQNDEEMELATLSKKTPLSRISSIWQMMERGSTEINNAENKNIALEMLIVRLCYASSIPDLSEIIQNCTAQSSQKGIPIIEPKTQQITEPINNTPQKEMSLKDEALKMFAGSSVL